jgi:hypothetical protein
MIEMRIVVIGDGCRSEIQYRYKNQLPPGCIEPPFHMPWSEWKTAEYVSLMETQND